MRQPWNALASQTLPQLRLSGAPAADAFFDWLAQHPPLLCFSVDAVLSDAQQTFGSTDFLVQALQLGRRRPALRVQCPGLQDEGKSLLDHIQKTFPF